MRQPHSGGAARGNRGTGNAAAVRIDEPGDGSLKFRPADGFKVPELQAGDKRGVVEEKVVGLNPGGHLIPVKLIGTTVVVDDVGEGKRRARGWSPAGPQHSQPCNGSGHA